METTFEVALRWREPSSPRWDDVQRRVRLDGRGEAFGLLEPCARGWVLCIPDGAELSARVRGAPVDPASLEVDASGERHLPLCPGLWAEVRMGEFRFDVRPAA